MTKFLFRNFGSAVLIVTLAGSALNAQAGWSVSIESPTNGQVYTASADIQLADFVDGTSPPKTELIQFFANSNLVGTFMNGPGTNRSSVMWTNVPAGTYSLTAVANTETGQETSWPVMITVNGAPSNSDTNPPPESAFGISFLSPNDISTFTAPANIDLVVTNIGFQDLIAGTNPPSEVVRFFANSNLVATTTNVLGTNVPNTIWTSVPAGTYTLVAVGNFGTNEATSDPMTITVNEAASNPATNPPPIHMFGIGILYPNDGGTFTTPADVVLAASSSGLEDLSGGTNPPLSEVVQFFANSNLVGTTTNTGWTNMAVFTWANVPAGTYTLVAAGSFGTNEATSDPVTITVNQGPPNPGTNPPSESGFGVGIQSPTNYQVYAAPGAIQLEDLVWGTSPTSTEVVQFFANSNLVATVTNGAGTNLSSVTWNAAAGQYVVSAIASCSEGASGASEPVTISVGDTNVPNSGPQLSIAHSTVVCLYAGDPQVKRQVNYVSGGNVYISIPATNGIAYSLEYSTDLIKWIPVSTNTLLNGVAQFVNPTGISSCQFYRTVPLQTGN